MISAASGPSYFYQMSSEWKPTLVSVGFTIRWILVLITCTGQHKLTRSSVHPSLFYDPFLSFSPWSIETDNRPWLGHGQHTPHLSQRMNIHEAQLLIMRGKYRHASLKADTIKPAPCKLLCKCRNAHTLTKTAIRSLIKMYGCYVFHNSSCIV